MVVLEILKILLLIGYVTFFVALYISRNKSKERKSSVIEWDVKNDTCKVHE